jgi:hypothetical protein
VKAPNHKGQAKSALDAVGIDQVCTWILEGRPMYAIAAEIGVSDGAFYKWFEADSERSARVKEARVKAGTSYVDKAERVIAEALEPFGLAKAKELAHHYRWKAKAVNPAQWGDKQQVDLNAKIDLGDALIKAINAAD